MRGKGTFALAFALAMLPWMSGASGAEQPDSVFWQLFRQIGAVLVSVSSLGEGEARQGSIWLTELDNGRARQVVAEPIYSYPVLDPGGETVIALRGGDIVRLDIATGQVGTLASDTRLRKLVGVAADGTILAVLEEGALGRPVMVSSAGTMSVMPAPETREERRNVALLSDESRAYSGDRTLVVDRSEHGFDVYLITSGGRRNITTCGEDACGQPALSNDGKSVVYIRGPAAP